MRISAKADYAVRAMVELAAAQDDRPVKGERVATAQGIPLKFLENILLELRRAGLVASQRGVDGGYRLDRAPHEITVADVIRAVDGPLANVRGASPETLAYEGSASALRDVWVALRASVRAVLETVTLADIVERRLPPDVAELLEPRDAWRARRAGSS